jgi:hypothetical protein
MSKLKFASRAMVQLYHKRFGLSSEFNSFIMQNNLIPLSCKAIKFFTLPAEEERRYCSACHEIAAYEIKLGEENTDDIGNLKQDALKFRLCIKCSQSPFFNLTGITKMSWGGGKQYVFQESESLTPHQIYKIWTTQIFHIPPPYPMLTFHIPHWSM